MFRVYAGGWIILGPQGRVPLKSPLKGSVRITLRIPLIRGSLIRTGLCLYYCKHMYLKWNIHAICIYVYS